MHPCDLAWAGFRLMLPICTCDLRCGRERRRGGVNPPLGSRRRGGEKNGRVGGSAYQQTVATGALLRFRPRKGQVPWLHGSAASCGILLVFTLRLFFQPSPIKGGRRTPRTGPPLRSTAAVAGCGRSRGTAAAAWSGCWRSRAWAPPHEGRRAAAPRSPARRRLAWGARQSFFSCPIQTSRGPPTCAESSAASPAAPARGAGGAGC
mmetsp:Transcript_50193/g.155075  ORF Transcript_50193/g.155075 Transcript_50193/m.155075 type:complete len:206 (-) Transcript_50193:3744-4361(-)